MEDFGALSTLPRECLWEICFFLDRKELAKIARLNKSFLALTQHSAFWKSLFRDNFPTIPLVIPEIVQKEMDWKRLLKDASDHIERSLAYISCVKGAGNTAVALSFGKHLIPTTGDGSAIPLRMWRTCTEEELKGQKGVHSAGPRHGHCLTFDPNNRDTVLLKLLPVCSNAISIFMQVRMDSSKTFQQNFFSLWHGEDRIVLEYHHPQTLGIYTSGGRMWDVYSKLHPDEWHTIFLIYDRGIIWLYIDGVPAVKGCKVAKESWCLNGRASSAAPLRLYLGSDRHDAYWSKCCVANVLLWNRALSSASLDFLQRL